jgi:tripartite ATP-independent transporter DctM subunit
MKLTKKSFFKAVRAGEDALVLAVFSGLALIPASEVVSRLGGFSIIPASPVYVQHLTLWIGFIGAVLAARRNKLLALTIHPIFTADDGFHFGRWLSKSISLIVVIILLGGTVSLLYWEIHYPIQIAPGVPRWIAQLIMPLGLALMIGQILTTSGKTWSYRLAMLSLAGIWALIVFCTGLGGQEWFIWLTAGVILVSLYFGTPIFIGLSGIAALLFWHSATPISAIPAEIYRIVVSPSLPTIPLFTLAGYLLAESKASTRILKLFHEAFGWLPGGMPIVIVIVSGFFTAMTGGSGVAILALGGLLLPLLIKEGYSVLFSIGLITVAGSVGLLFPPSLPAILYGVYAGISVKDVFIAGFIPGLLLIILISAWAVYQGKIQNINRNPVKIKSLLSAIWIAKWELVIPMFILIGIFGGFSTLVETASLVVIYTLIVEMLILKDISISALPRIVIECATIIGGVLIILGSAMGLTSYLVDAQIPLKLLAWVKAAISSKYVFLLMLNILLLCVGCLMDIFSAIIVFVPLIAPLGAHFGIDPVHLAVIFIANLELGFLTPPVGMNLFLSAYRFDKTMPEVYKATLPYFIIRLIAVIGITYIPIISIGLLQ